MAYQSVSVPRFYCNVVEFLNTVGYIDINDSHDGFWNTLPVNPKNFAGGDSPNVGSSYLRIPIPFDMQNGFVAVLGHTNNTQNAYYYLEDHNTNHIQMLPVVNAPLGGEGYYDAPDYNGFSISKFDGMYDASYSASLWYKQGNNSDLGSIVIGEFYDMPHSPNLSLTMSREYGETKEFTTYNGSSMSNTMNTGSPRWGNLGAWELEDPQQLSKLSKSGRRSWNLKFSYLDSGTLWGSNQMLFKDYIYTTEGYDSDDYDASKYTWNLLDDDNFFSKVWARTLSGSLPFLFNPAGGGTAPNNNPDMFAICRFKNNSLKATQSAHNVYDISLIIEEVW